MNSFYLPDYYFYNNETKEKKSYNYSVGDLDIHRFIQNKPYLAINKQESILTPKTIILQNFYDIIYNPFPSDLHFCVELISILLHNNFKVYGTFNNELKAIENSSDVYNFIKHSEYNLKHEIYEQAKRQSLEEDKFLIFDILEMNILSYMYKNIKDNEELLNTKNTHPIVKETLKKIKEFHILYRPNVKFYSNFEKILADISKEKYIFNITNLEGKASKKIKKSIKELGYKNIIINKTTNQINTFKQKVEKIVEIKNKSYSTFNLLLFPYKLTSENKFSYYVDNISISNNLPPNLLPNNEVNEKIISNLMSKKKLNYKFTYKEEISDENEDDDTTQIELNLDFTIKQIVIHLDDYLLKTPDYYLECFNTFNYPAKEIAITLSTQNINEKRILIFLKKLAPILKQKKTTSLLLNTVNRIVFFDKSIITIPSLLNIFNFIEHFKSNNIIYNQENILLHHKNSYHKLISFSIFINHKGIRKKNLVNYYDQENKKCDLTSLYSLTSNEELKKYLKNSNKFQFQITKNLINYLGTLPKLDKIYINGLNINLTSPIKDKSELFINLKAIIISENTKINYLNNFISSIPSRVSIFYKTNIDNKIKEIDYLKDIYKIKNTAKNFYFFILDDDTPFKKLNSYQWVKENLIFLNKIIKIIQNSNSQTNQESIVNLTNLYIVKSFIAYFEKIKPFIKSIEEEDKNYFDNRLNYDKQKVLFYKKYFFLRKEKEKIENSLPIKYRLKFNDSFKNNSLFFSTKKNDENIYIPTKKVIDFSDLPPDDNHFTYSILKKEFKLLKSEEEFIPSLDRNEITQLLYYDIEGEHPKISFKYCPTTGAFKIFALENCSFLFKAVVKINNSYFNQQNLPEELKLC